MTAESRESESGREQRRKAETEAAREAATERKQPDEIVARVRLQRQAKKQHKQDGKEK